MADIGIGIARKLVDSDGDALDDGDGKLNVNATLVGGAAIDIGDVDIHLSGNVPLLGGAGNVAAGVLRVTLATDDTHFGAVGAGADVDGVIHAQLRYMGEKLDGIDSDTNSLQSLLGTDGNTGPTKCLSIGGTTALGAIQEILVDSDGGLQVDVTSISAGTNVIGKVGHDITGLASDDNPTVGTSAEQLITDGVDGATACKRVDIMAHPSNTGYIWVGDSAVSVDGLNGGIRLSPGDFYSMDIDNTGDIYVIATVDTENVCYNYFT